MHRTGISWTPSSALRHPTSHRPPQFQREAAPMPISASRRARINRQNAARSTGPRTPEGKDRSRRNATKHGLCIETLALPGEAAEQLRARPEEWNDRYRARTPGEAELVEM